MDQHQYYSESIPQAYHTIDSNFKIAVSKYNEKLYSDALIDFSQLSVNQSHRIISLKFAAECARLIRDYDAAKAFALQLYADAGQVDALDFLAKIESERGEYFEALSWNSKALLKSPKSWTPYYNRGTILFRLRKVLDAIDSFEQARALNPDNQEILNNLAVALMAAGRYQEALSIYIDFLKINADDVYAQSQIGQILLLHECFPEGWDFYESRNKRCDHFEYIVRKPTYIHGNHVNRNILVWSEQGIGDEIFFASVLRNLEYKKNNFIIKVDRRLVPIFSRSMPQFRYIANDDDISTCDFDAQIAIGSLARYYRSSADDFVASPFLIVDSETSKKIAKNIKNSSKLRVGISWMTRNSNTGLDRSILISDFAAAFHELDVVLVPLQYGITYKDLDILKSQSGCEICECPEIDRLNDLDELASLITLCDLVVTIDNLTVHLAGALGIKTALLLPTDPNWRWGLSRKKSLWYQSVDLIRQSKLADWSGPLLEIRSRVKKLVQVRTKQ